MDLRSQIEALAIQFAGKVLDAIRSASLTELAGLSSSSPVTKPRPVKSEGRLRRTAEDIAAMSDDILAYVKDHPGCRSEEIKKALGISANEWAKPISLALSQGLKKSGNKRATEYYFEEPKAKAKPKAAKAKPKAKPKAKAKAKPKISSGPKVKSNGIADVRVAAEDDDEDEVVEASP